MANLRFICLASAMICSIGPDIVRAEAQQFRVQFRGFPEQARITYDIKGEASKNVTGPDWTAVMPRQPGKWFHQMDAAFKIERQEIKILSMTIYYDVMAKFTFVLNTKSVYWSRPLVVEYEKISARHISPKGIQDIEGHSQNNLQATFKKYLLARQVVGYYETIRFSDETSKAVVVPLWQSAFALATEGQERNNGTDNIVELIEDAYLKFSAVHGEKESQLRRRAKALKWRNLYYATPTSKTRCQEAALVYEEINHLAQDIRHGPEFRDLYSTLFTGKAAGTYRAIGQVINANCNANLAILEIPSQRTSLPVLDSR